MTETKTKVLQEAKIHKLGLEKAEVNETVVKAQNDEVAGDIMSKTLLQTGGTGFQYDGKRMVRKTFFICFFLFLFFFRKNLGADYVIGEYQYYE